jgi:probable F420-dependent oxidoreductase
MFKLIANLDFDTPLAEISSAAWRAEALGFDRISIPDVCHDGLMAATLAAQATQQIEIANSALVCFPRSPMTTAVAVWDLQAFSGGRYQLGLGPLVAPNIIQKYSTHWFPPAPRMREYVHAMQAIFRCWQHGEPLNYRGTYYQFSRQQAYTAPPPIDHPDIPLHLAAVGPNMAALAGEVADSVTTHPTNTSPRFLREKLFVDIAKGAARSGRKPETLGVIVNPLIATGGSSAEIAHARKQHRQMLATVFSTPNYWRSLELFGWGDLGPRLREMTRQGRWGEMAGLFTDEMVNAFVLTAPWDELPALLREAYGGLATALALTLPRQARDDAAIARVVAELRNEFGRAV